MVESGVRKGLKPDYRGLKKQQLKEKKSRQWEEAAGSKSFGGER